MILPHSENAVLVVIRVLYKFINRKPLPFLPFDFQFSSTNQKIAFY